MSRQLARRTGVLCPQFRPSSLGCQNIRLRWRCTAPRPSTDRWPLPRNCRRDAPSTKEALRYLHAEALRALPPKAWRRIDRSAPPSSPEMFRDLEEWASDRALSIGCSSSPHVVRIVEQARRRECSSSAPTHELRNDVEGEESDRDEADGANGFRNLRLARGRLCGARFVHLSRALIDRIGHLLDLLGCGALLDLLYLVARYGLERLLLGDIFYGLADRFDGEVHCHGGRDDCETDDDRRQYADCTRHFYGLVRRVLYLDRSSSDDLYSRKIPVNPLERESSALVSAEAPLARERLVREPRQRRDHRAELLEVLIEATVPCSGAHRALAWINNERQAKPLADVLQGSSRTRGPREGVAHAIANGSNVRFPRHRVGRRGLTEPLRGDFRHIACSG